ncbi:MAG: potassium-transporting ATPase subunit KdpA [Fimbriimonadaceae bacterium]
MADSWLKLIVFLTTVLLIAYPLGLYIAEVLEGRTKFLGWLEKPIYFLIGTAPEKGMDWKRYTFAVLLFSLVNVLVLYALMMLQTWLFGAESVALPFRPDEAFNAAISFVTNTNWQSYSPELSASAWVQMLGFTVQNFVSAAVGVGVLAALMRGLRNRESANLGNFFVDVTRVALYVLVPLSLLLAVFLVSQGVVQTMTTSVTAITLEGEMVQIPLGPVASQVAIKQIGTNGGGYFAANSAHPFENPTALSGFFELVAILLIPAALCFTFGKMVRDMRQGNLLLIAMTLIFVGATVITMLQEAQPNPMFAEFGVDQARTATLVGGNMEGKELRFGPASSAIWASATTAASSGSVNSMHDSYFPMSGLMLFLLMQTGEAIFGGVGSGLYLMVAFAMVGVFLGGLMIGRTPEYLGKKIEAFEMKMVGIIILVPGFLILLGSGIALMFGNAEQSMTNPGPHGYSQLLYAMTSQGTNNGSAFAGFLANTPFLNVLGGLLIWFGRFLIIVCILAIAGSVARKKVTPNSSATLPTHTPLFLILLFSVILLNALTFLPALALGPVAEQFQLFPPGGVR